MSRTSHGRPPMPGFVLDYVEWSPTMSDRVYRLKDDLEWFVRSDRSSKRWAVYHEPERDFPVSKVVGTQAAALAMLRDGVNQGFYTLAT